MLFFEKAYDRFNSFMSTINYNKKLQCFLAVYYSVLVSHSYAWDRAAMDVFPITFSAIHLAAYFVTLIICLIVPLVLAIVFSVAVLKITVIPGAKAMFETYTSVVASIDVFTGNYALPYLSKLVLLSEKLGIKIIHFKVLSLYQYCEVRYNWDNFYSERQLELMEEADISPKTRSPIWFIKTEEDWLDESNPRLVAALKSNLGDWIRNKQQPWAIARIKLKKENPEEYAMIVQKELELEAIYAREDAERRAAHSAKLEAEAAAAEELALKSKELALAAEKERDPMAWQKVWPHISYEDLKNNKYPVVEGIITKEQHLETLRAISFPIGATVRREMAPFYLNRNLDLREVISKGKIEKTRIDELKADLFLKSFENSAFDFTIPASAEFRSILELYSFVMYILLFIFISLILGLIFALIVPQEQKAEINYKIITLKSTVPGETVEARIIVKKEWWNTKKWENTAKKYPQILPIVTKILYIIRRYRVTEFAKFRAGTGGEIYWVYLSRLEAIWTTIPVLFLILISLPSFTLALALDEAHKPQNWLKVNASQWFWVYEYGNFSEVDGNIGIGELYSNVVQGEDLVDNSLRLLEVDGIIAIPANHFTRLLITSTDVIHSFGVPSLGLKVDACPGRINAVTLLPTKCGMHYGQCSEICGVNHAFMPICIEVIA